MNPRRDDALFYGLAVGAIFFFVVVRWIIGPVLISIGLDDSVSLGLVMFGLPAAAGGATYLVICRRGRELQRRAREGCCLQCGYNLTGNVSGRCPECGAKS